MITEELRSKIRRLYFAKHWKAGTIAAELGVHRDTVLLAIEARSFLSETSRARAGLLDPYRGFLEETLEVYPRVRATRLWEMVRGRGYAGSVYPIRRFLRRRRPAKSEAFHASPRSSARRRRSTGEASGRSASGAPRDGFPAS